MNLGLIINGMPVQLPYKDLCVTDGAIDFAVTIPDKHRGVDVSGAAIFDGNGKCVQKTMYLKRYRLFAKDVVITHVPRHQNHLGGVEV